MADHNALHLALLRPPVLTILRAAGFATTRPSVLDTLVDLTSRYLILLAQRTAEHAGLHPEEQSSMGSQDSPAQNLNSFELLDGEQPQPSSEDETSLVSVADMRLAMQDLGLFTPQASVCEEKMQRKEDLRGIENFIAWCIGDKNAEIRRIAGMHKPARLGAEANKPGDAINPTLMAPNLVSGQDTTSISADNQAVKASSTSLAGKDPASDALAAAIGLHSANEDFLTVLKKKHFSKAGEESRYQGTILGKDLDARDIAIEGWEWDPSKTANEDQSAQLTAPIRKGVRRKAGSAAQAINSIKAWEQYIHKQRYGNDGRPSDEAKNEDAGMDGGSGSSSPLTDLSGSPLSD